MSREIGYTEVDNNFHAPARFRVYGQEGGKTMADTPLEQQEVQRTETDNVRFISGIPVPKASRQPTLALRTSGNIYGHDIHHTIVNPDGTPVTEQAETDTELYARMLSYIQPGVHQFKGYPYPVTVLLSENRFFHITEGLHGEKSVYAHLYTRGDHERNHVGFINPNGWSLKRNEQGKLVRDKDGNPIKEDETEVFVTFFTSSYEPGVVYTHLAGTDPEKRSELVDTKRLYTKMKHDEVHMQRMKDIEQKAKAYRQSHPEKQPEEQLSLPAD